MSELTIAIKNGQNEVKKQVAEQEELVMVYEDTCEPGDTITFETSEMDTHYAIRVDDTMDEAYMCLTSPSVGYTIPFDEKKMSYNPRPFTGERRYITMRNASGYEDEGYRDLAKNVMDQHGDLGCCPHTYANVETRGESVFATRSTIDGVVASESHGVWPYESWGINIQDDVEMTLSSGRPASFDAVVLYTRAGFPHDDWWVKATFTFSNGSSQVVGMEEGMEPHSFWIEKKGTTWMRLSQLIKADDSSPFPASSQIEVYGKNAK